MDSTISRISVAAMDQDMMRSRYCPGGYQSHLSVCLTSSAVVGVVAVFGLINALIGWHDASAQPVATQTAECSGHRNGPAGNRPICGKWERRAMECPALPHAFLKSLL